MKEPKITIQINNPELTEHLKDFMMDYPNYEVIDVNSMTLEQLQKYAIEREVDPTGKTQEELLTILKNP